ncbi:MAG: cyclopropane fatty acyl phospholipid synthase [Gammaproteobacteria bacterium]
MTEKTAIAKRQAGAEAAPAPRILRDVLEGTGVRFNGSEPWDIRVHNPEVYRRIILQGSLGFGEAYMDGLWDCDALDQLFHLLLQADIDRRVLALNPLRLLAARLRYLLVNAQSPERAFEVGERHYDIGNDVFSAMLDPTMSYSCGYWAQAGDLAEAQQAKLDLICRKLELQPGDRLLDIGCGWGGMAEHAARHYGAEVFGITVSREQLALARERCAGLRVQLELMDYRDLDGRFDKIVSVGMFEHVGAKNYPTYFDVAHRALKNDGLFLLHTIGESETTRTGDPWISRYIFPNGKVPSAQQISAALERRLIIEDWHNFGQDYDRTLMAWWQNFDAAWPGLRERYGQRFYRMWKYYLLSCAGYFRARRGQLWQLVLTKRPRASTYRSVR